MYNLNIIIHNSLLIKSQLFHINYSVYYWTVPDDSRHWQLRRHCLDSMNLTQILFYQTTYFGSVATWFHYYFLHFLASLQLFLFCRCRLGPSVSWDEREGQFQSLTIDFMISHRRFGNSTIAVGRKLSESKWKEGWVEHGFEIKKIGLRRRPILIWVHFLWPGNRGSRNQCLFSHKRGCKRGCWLFSFRYRRPRSHHHWICTRCHRFSHRLYSGQPIASLDDLRHQKGHRLKARYLSIADWW